MRASLGERDYLSAWNAIPASRLRFGLGELLFFFACMSAYRAWWDRLRNWRSIHRLLAIAAASNLFLHFPTLFAIVSVLATRHGTWAEPLDRSGYWQLLVDPEVMSRVVHVWLAALAVSGVVLMALATRLPEEPAGQADRRRLVGRGAWLALVPTLLQIPAGIWLAFELPETSRLPLLGGDLVATGLFVAAMLLALYLMHALASIALGDHEPKRVRHAVAVLCVLVVLMVGTRSRIDSSAAVPGASLSGLHRAKVAFQ